MAIATDEIREEIDALVRRCCGFPRAELRREHVAACEEQLIRCGWEPREAERVAEGTLWVLGLRRK